LARLALAPDGLMKPPPPDELQVFPARVRTPRKKGSLYVRIPKAVAEALRLERDSLLEVAVRPVDEAYCREAYSFVPPKGRGRAEPAPRVTCPRCGRLGRLRKCMGEGKYPTFYVMHRRLDGFDRPTNHYISWRDFRGWIEEQLKLMGEAR
jgi:hypothetical protein